MRHNILRGFAFAIVVLSTGGAAAQTTTPGGGAARTPSAMGAAPAIVTPPADYLIGPEDVLSIFFWREKDLTVDVVVRPDGKISLPVINELQAAGLTPEELRQSVIKAAAKFFNEDPTVNVIVKQINSRKVFITGEVSKPGPYPLLEPMTVLQLIAKAGGLNEFANKKRIRVVRAEKRPDGAPWTVAINYNDLLDGKNMKQNVELKPGDTVIVR